MGNNPSSLRSKESSTKNNELINKLFENNIVDTLNMNDYNTNKKDENESSIPIIRVSQLPQLGGTLPVINKYNNQFITSMNKNRIFNLIHETEIEQYHLNNMKKEGILNNQDTVIRGGSVPNTTNKPEQPNESDVSDAMNRIKEVIANELKEQELKGGAKDSNGCGCGGQDDNKKHNKKCEFGKGKKHESSLKNRREVENNSSSSSKSSSESEDGIKYKNEESSNEEGNSSNESEESSSTFDKEKGMRRNTGLSVFPFNSSDISSNKNQRHPRRKI